MSISNEIKRMMSLLESELGNVKPLITEQGEPPIEVLDSPLKRAVNVGCWTKKGYTISDPKIYQLGKDYLYAFSKIAPSVQAGDSFMKIATPDGRDLYMFEIPSTDPVALAKNPKAYLAVNRTAVKASTDPNLNYLAAHGWYCDEFNVTQNLASQQNNLTADQQQQIDILLSDLGTQDTGYSFFKTKLINCFYYILCTAIKSKVFINIDIIIITRRITLCAVNCSIWFVINIQCDS